MLSAQPGTNAPAWGFLPQPGFIYTEPAGFTPQTPFLCAGAQGAVAVGVDVMPSGVKPMSPG